MNATRGFEFCDIEWVMMFGEAPSIPVCCVSSLPAPVALNQAYVAYGPKHGSLEC